MRFREINSYAGGTWRRFIHPFRWRNAKRVPIKTAAIFKSGLRYGEDSRTKQRYSTWTRYSHGWKNKIRVRVQLSSFHGISRWYCSSTIRYHIRLHIQFNNNSFHFFQRYFKRFCETLSLLFSIIKSFKNIRWAIKYFIINESRIA